MKMILKKISLFILLFAANNAIAQVTKAEKADYFFNELLYAQAIPVYEELLKTSSDTDNCVTEPAKFNQESTLRSFHPVTEDDIRKLISSSASKSSILDPIPIYLLKEFLDTLLPTITRIINLSPIRDRFWLF